MHRQATGLRRPPSQRVAPHVTRTMAGLLNMAGLSLTGAFAGAQLRVPTPAARVSHTGFSVVAVRVICAFPIFTRRVCVWPNRSHATSVARDVNGEATVLDGTAVGESHRHCVQHVVGAVASRKPGLKPAARAHHPRAYRALEG